MSAEHFTAPPVYQTDPARITRIGVWCGEHLWTFTPDGEPGPMVPLSTEGGTLDAVIGWSIALHCAALWILPLEALDRGDWPASARDLLDLAARGLNGYTAHALSGRNGELVGLICQGEARGQRAPMGVYPAWLATWGTALHFSYLPRDPASRARVFASGVLEAARLLGMQLRFSPSYTGLQMLRQELSTHRYPIPPLSEAARDLIVAHPHHDLRWCRAAPATLERHGGYLIKYDRNSSFVASAGEVPVGDPLPADRYQPGCPGFYRVSLVGTGELLTHSRDLPGPLQFGAGAGTWPAVPPAGVETWVWEPQLRVAQRLAYPLHIHEGYYWPRTQRHDLFRTWRERIWTAREQARMPLARTIIKQVGVSTIGRLGQRQGHAVMRTAQAREQGLRVRAHEVDAHGELTGMGEVLTALGRSDLYWPHCRYHIVANATERLQTALYSHQGYGIIGAYVDAVYCLAEWPIEDLDPDRLGKWKLERRVWLTGAQWQELNAIAADPRAEGAYQWVARVAQFARLQSGWEREAADGSPEDENAGE